ncbi:MAG: hypothetical protein E7361_01485 [Clostridiales bacterium]|nr:hypothetical protein [Clostridiales bacterium]
MPVYPSNKSSIVSKKKKHQSKLAIVLISVFSVLLALLMLNIFPVFSNFIYGVFGLCVYPVGIFFIVFGVMRIRKVNIKLSSKEVVYLVLSSLCLIAMAHIFTSSTIINNSYAHYLLQSFNCSKCYTAGGVIFSFVVYPVYSLTHLAGASVVFAIILLTFLCLFVDSIYKRKQTRMYIEDSVSNIVMPQEEEEEEEYFEQATPTFDEVPYDEDVFISDDEDVKVEKKAVDKSIARRILGLEKEQPVIIDEDDEDLFAVDEEVAEPKRRPNMVFHDDEEEDEVDEPVVDMGRLRTATVSFSASQSAEAAAKYERDKRNRDYLDDIMGRSSVDVPPRQEIRLDNTYGKTDNRYNAKEKLFGTAEQENLFTSANRYVDERPKPAKPKRRQYAEQQDLFDENLTLRGYEKNKSDYIDRLNNFDTASAQIAKANEVYNMRENTDRRGATSYTSNVVNVNEINKIRTQAEKAKPKRRPYVKPPIDLLDTYTNDNVVEENNEEKARRLEATLDSFRIPAKVCSVARGPSFTRFELTMPIGISVKKIDNLVPDMQMALACKGSIRTEIPIPGKNAFGVEIPNEQKETVGLKDIIDSYEFQNSKYKTAYGLGKDISNSPIIGNIEKMPHLLVAGTTGSGKSVCLNSLLISLLYKSGPEDLRLILIDPKRLEFSLYNGLPHLLVPNVITDKEKAMNAFDWLIDEMNRRINFFDSLKAGIRNIDEYNSCAKVKSGELEKMPTIVVVVDELNELMMQTRKEMESKIVRIAQLSRAVGIHLVLATQRPSTDVITGLVKSNLPSRIAFAVSSFNDSITILNQGGAESLLGYGDMLYSPVGTNKPQRIQGAFLKNSEVEKVVNFIKENNDCIFDEEVEDKMFNRNNDDVMSDSGSGASGGGNANNMDPLMKDVLRFAIKSGNISTTKVQRFLRIGYPRAAKIIDDMEAMNYISKKDDKNNRIIFMSQQEFEEVFGEDF